MAKAVTLKKNNEEVYPVTDISLVNGEIPTARIADGAITVNKLDPNATGWVYLGCVKAPSGNFKSLEFELPAQYDNYKIIASGVNSSTCPNNSWMDLRALNGTTTITTSGQINSVDGTTSSYSTPSNTSYISLITSYAYFSFYFEVDSFRTGSGEHRHYVGHAFSGSGNTNPRYRWTNMHSSSSTQPTKFQLLMGGTYMSAGQIRVWGSNNPAS